MTSLRAPAKINLALVVGPVRADGKHEVVTVLQHVDLYDRIELADGDRLTVTGFSADTIVREALTALAGAAGVAPRWQVRITKEIPVAAGLGGGSSDAAAALRLANASLPTPLEQLRLEELAATIGADVPFFLRDGPQLGSDAGAALAPLDLPQDFWIVLVLPSATAKSSTAAVYAAFDERGGEEGFDGRRATLLDALATVERPDDLARLPSNDLAASPVSDMLRGAGAFRADVSGAGPCAYGLFSDRQRAEAAARSLHATGRTWVVSPVSG